MGRNRPARSKDRSSHMAKTSGVEIPGCSASASLRYRSRSKPRARASKTARPPMKKFGRVPARCPGRHCPRHRDRADHPRNRDRISPASARRPACPPARRPVYSPQFVPALPVFADHRKDCVSAWKVFPWAGRWLSPSWSRSKTALSQPWTFDPVAWRGEPQLTYASTHRNLY